MTGFSEKNGILHVDDVSLVDIANEYGTPTYVYSASHIREQFEKLQDTMQKILPADRQPLLCYACKANSNLAVLKLLQGMGCGLEIVSEGELIRGLRAGFDPQMIVSTGVGKKRNEIRAALENEIHQINVESLPELEMINDIAAETGEIAPVVLRLNPDVSGGGHSKIATGRKDDKFGISTEKIFEGFERAKDLDGVHILGLSVHIGSQVFTVESFRAAFEKLPALVQGLRDKGYEVSRLDIGGGFPIQYQDEPSLNLEAYAEWVRDIIVPLDTQIIMEPGRFLVGNAGVLLTQALFVKETEERTFLILNAAMNDLIRPTLYEAWHGIEPVQNRSAPAQTYDVVGPVCETGDTFAQNREIPEMAQGDLAVIKSAGAYGFCMASNYNTRPLPAEILVEGKNHSIIRQRQSYEDIIDKDTIPDWLS